jgi:hypothetical protein
VVASVAGIAVLISFIGATAMWVRLRVNDYPAVFAIDHLPKTQIFALGLKSVGLLATLVAIPLLVAAIIDRLLRSIAVPVVLVATSAVGVGITVFGLFSSWRWFGFGLALTVTAIAIAAWIQWEPPLGILVACLTIAAAVGAICWSLPTRAGIQGVYVDPPPTEASSDVAIPYFGESDGYFFVSEVTGSTQGPDGVTFKTSGNILALKRETHQLRFFGGPTFIYNDIRPPAEALPDLIARGIDYLMDEPE